MGVYLVTKRRRIVEILHASLTALVSNCYPARQKAMGIQCMHGCLIAHIGWGIGSESPRTSLLLILVGE